MDGNVAPSNIPLAVWITYGFVMPAVCVLGVIGNSLSVVILSKKPFQKSVMYAYLKGLALTDMSFLVCNAQICYFILRSHMWYENNAGEKTSMSLVGYGERPEAKGVEFYQFNILPVLLSSFGASSDFVIVFMTINRFKLVQEIEKMKVVRFKKWMGYTEVVCAFLFSFLCNIPYFFKNEIKSCQDTNPNRTEFNNYPDGHCWDHVASDITKDPIWETFNLLSQFISRVMPTVMICSLNILMFIRLRKVLKQRYDKADGLPCKLSSYLDLKTLKRFRCYRPKPTEPSNGSTTTTTLPSSGSTKHSFWKPRNSFEVDLTAARPSISVVETASEEFPDVQRRRSVFLLATPDLRRRRSTQGKIGTGRELRKSSKLLALIVIAHVTLSIPGNVVYIWATFDADLLELPGAKEPSYQPMILLFSCLHVAFVANYAINFVLYCLANNDIRKETVGILSSLKSKLIDLFCHLSVSCRK